MGQWFPPLNTKLKMEIPMKLQRHLLIGTLLMSVMGAMPALAQDYDLVIIDGRVIDPETMYDDVANVGIKDGRIATITKQKITGRETIKAKGLVVAPGFIDTHFHFQMPIGYALGLRDGLTSSMDFEMGCAGSYVAAWYEARAGVPRVCPRDGARWVGRRRVPAERPRSRLHNPGKNGLERDAPDPGTG